MVPCRRTLLVFLTLAATLLVATAPAAAQPGVCSSAHAKVERKTVRHARNATLCLLNRARSRYGLPPLRLNPKLSRAARRHSRDMVRRRYFAHDSLDGRSAFDRMRATRYVPRNASWVLGENIGWGSGSLSAPMSLVRAWMHSPGHRRNILDGRFRDIGIGIVPGSPVPTGGSSPATYTTDFGRHG